MTAVERRGQPTPTQDSGSKFAQELELQKLRIIHELIRPQENTGSNDLRRWDMAEQLLKHTLKTSNEVDLQESCVTEAVESRIDTKDKSSSKLPFRELIQQPLLRKIVLRIAQSGKYNFHTKQFEGTMKQAYATRVQSLGESSDLSADDDEVAPLLETLRKKLNQPGWDFGKIYHDIFDNEDPAGIFKETKPIVKDERHIHKHLSFHESVYIFGRRHNVTGLISSDESTSAPSDKGFYYIGEGLVACTGVAMACRCGEGKVSIVVTKVYDAQTELRHVSVPESLQVSGILQVDETVEWPEELLQVGRSENKRKKESSKSMTTKRSKTEVRTGTRPIRRPHSLDDCVLSATLGRKAGKNKGRKKGRISHLLAASKPEIVQVTTKSGRKASKLMK